MKLAIVIGALASFTTLYAADVTAGKALYQRSCRNCHGENGEGNPQIAKMMKVELKHLGSPEVQAMSDQDIEKIITVGKGKMTSIHTVTAEQIKDIVAYVRTLKGK